MKQKKILITLSSVFLIVCLVTFVAQASEQSRLRMAAEEFYKNKDVSDIIDDMKKADSLIDINLDDFFALGEKIKSSDNKLLSFLIKSNSAFPYLQSALLQLATEYDLTVSEKVIRSLLNDENAIPQLRLDVMYYCGAHGKEYEKDIEALVYDEEYGFAAQRELYGIDAERALELSEEIIAKRSSTFTDPLDGAMYVQSLNLADNTSTPEERKAYIALCEEIMSAVKDEKCSWILTNYIGYTESYETLSYITEREDIENSEKYQYIFSAREFIVSMLKEPAEYEKASFLIKAMNCCCAPEFYDAFSEYITDNRSFFEAHTDLTKEAEKAMHAIEEERIASHID